jgi:hypothetical protein
MISETTSNGVTRSDYNSTLDSRITENFNNASLCLGDVRLDNSHAHPDNIEKVIFSFCEAWFIDSTTANQCARAII